VNAPKDSLWGDAQEPYHPPTSVQPGTCQVTASAGAPSAADGRFVDAELGVTCVTRGRDLSQGRIFP